MFLFRNIHIHLVDYNLSKATKWICMFLKRNIHIHLVDYNLSKAKPGYHSFISFPTSYDHQHFLLIPQHKLESDNCQDRYRELLSSPYILDCESFEDRLLCVLHRRDGQIFICWCCKKAAAAAAKSLQSCPTLCDPMDCSLPGSSIHGIFQARVLCSSSSSLI